MKTLLAFLIFVTSATFYSFAQSTFNYTVELIPVSIPGLPGLHSIAFAQHEGKWLIIGGRKDGIHARQPSSAFPATENNTDIYVIDVNKKQYWSASVNSLATGLKEQLQSTNMNFHQANDTLYIIGGYAFSTTANDHITFPKLTTVRVSALINAIIAGEAITSFFKQIEDAKFANTGGQLGKIGDTFYLIGGHRFDGRYNPAGNPTFTQTYSSKIQKFSINNSGSQLSFSNYLAITDEVHLRRRDYNLLPQIFPDRTEGYTISSGVFQINADLPFLYPVDITANGYNPVTSFNQYLSNYHCAKVCLYDSLANTMHNIFFGGISQYYYQNGTLVQDNLVPFVKTISRVSRTADGTLHEFQLPVEMPGLQGSSAELIPNMNLPHTESEIIKLEKIEEKTVVLGHIVGGISSPSLNPFSNNITGTTSATTTIYEVHLTNDAPTGEYIIEGDNPYDFQVFPNPAGNKININYYSEGRSFVEYFITNFTGQIVDQGEFGIKHKGNHSQSLSLSDAINSQILLVTLVFDNKYFVSKKLIKN